MIQYCYLERTGKEGMLSMQHRTEPCQKNIRLTILGTLAAVELLMSFSFLGYLHIEPLSITFAYIPVLLAGAMAGVPEAAAIGALFGLASMWKASASYVASFDQLFSPVLSGHPLKSILLSVGTRILFGVLTGLLFAAVKRLPHAGIGIFAVGFLGKGIHSLLVYGALGLFFPESGYSISQTFTSFSFLSDTVSGLVIGAIVFLGWKLEQSRFWKKYWIRMEKVQSRHLEDRYHRLSLVILLALVLCMAIAVAVYFVQRMEYVLKERGVPLSPVDYGNLVHLQIQFVIGILSLMALVAIFLIFNRRYATYLTNEARVDALTGLMTRKTFLHVCLKSLEAHRDTDGKWGYFVMVDVDLFKELNDEYGHPEGDRILRAIAGKLRDTFDDLGSIGRMGGDEFAVLVFTPISQAHLQDCLEQFLRDITTIHAGTHTVSCSAGAVAIQSGKGIEHFYREADQALYQAKHKGRGQYVLLKETE